MITLKELNPKNFPVSEVQSKNLAILLERMNKVRTAYGKVMIVTSGLRSIEDHKRIYKEMGIAEDKIPMGSNHLKGAACDISDADGKLFDWVKANEKLMASIGLWMEEKDSHKRVHFQIFPYGSWKQGKSQFFKP
jgi:uncharacterized protein YcbK (DUF882 family)